MKTILLYFLIFFSVFESYGQNLVPNPSLEDTLACPAGISQIYLANGWSSFRESADLFHSCETNNTLGVPINARGNQYAFGEAYVGIACFHRTVPNIREYFGIQLSQSLMPGQKYFFSMFVSLADTLGFDCPSSGIGVNFSTASFTTISPYPITNTAKISASNVIADKINWTPITGSFVADSAYQYMIIGNFFDDMNTDTSNCFLYSYYYIDDICVSPDSLYCDQLQSINNIESNIIQLFPNPANDYIQVSGENIEFLEIYNMAGKLIYKNHEQPTKNEILISTTVFADGLYMLRYSQGERSGSSKFVIQH